MSALVVLLLVIAGAVAVWRMDVNTLAAPLRARIKDATGRDLTIDGGVSLRLSLHPHVEMRDVTLSNAPWGTDKALLKAGKVEAELALVPLLQRKLALRSVTLTDPIISLERDEKGRGNWELATAHAAERSGTGTSEPGAAVLFGVGNVTIDRGVLLYRGTKAAAPVEIRVDRLELQARDLDAPVNATFRGSIAGTAVAVTGHAGPLAALLNKRWPYDIAVDGSVAERKVKADTKLAVSDATTELTDLRLVLGDTILQGRIVVPAGERQRVRVQLATERLRLADMDVTGPAGSAPAAGPTSSGASTPARGGVLPVDPLALGAIPALPLDADITAGEIVRSDGAPWRNVHARFTSGDGRLDMPLLELDALGGRARLSLHIDATVDPPRVRLQASSDDLDLGTMLASAGGAIGVKGGRTRLRLELTTRGVSVHDWARHANGSLSADVGPANITHSKGAQASAVTELIGTVLPIANASASTELRCAVVRLPVRDGVGRAERSIGIETDKVNLVGSGTIDFANETVDLAVRPSLAGGGKFDLGQLAGLVHWRGPWRSARVTIDPASAVGTVASVGALLAGGVALGPIAGVLAPRVLPSTPACAVARGG